jgi:hypothetical protein
MYSPGRAQLKFGDGSYHSPNWQLVQKLDSLGGYLDAEASVGAEVAQSNVTLSTSFEETLEVDGQPHAAVLGLPIVADDGGRETKVKELLSWNTFEGDILPLGMSSTVN